MKFGPVPVSEAAGAIAAHSVRLGPVIIRKGATISPEQADALGKAGVPAVVAARLDPDDVGEDEAAAQLAAAAAGSGVRLDPPFTGRANLFATDAGLLAVTPVAVDRINAVDESLTIATLAAWKPVVAGEMVATVKVIPFAVPRAMLDQAIGCCSTGDVVRVLPWRVRSVGVVSTILPGLKPSVVTKTLNALRDRLAPARAAIVDEQSCPHEAGALATSLRKQVAGPAEMVVVFGASAITDRRDVIPAAIEAAGGTVEHFGMPVDPGNLLLLGQLDGKTVIGAPGCARSPKENGFDWMLHRLLAGVPITRADITALGVGGLLMEIVSRPQPRAGGEPDHDE